MAVASQVMVYLPLLPLPPCHLLLQQNPEQFILLVPAYPGCPGKKAVKWLCVCVSHIMLEELAFGVSDVVM